MSSGIYEIRNTLNGHVYIGSAVDIKKRWYKHINELRNNKHHSGYLQKAFNKYGEYAFVFTVLEFCEKEQLLAREQEYLDKNKPVYNIAPVAGSSLGIKRTKESIAKMSLAKRNMSEETKNKIRNSMRGKFPTDETRRKLSEARKGKSFSIEHRSKLSLALIGNSRNRGKALSDETRKKISEAKKGNQVWKGRTHSEETKKKMSESGKNRWHNKKDEGTI